MYRTIRTIRIVIALATMLLPAWALVAGHETVFSNMQILTALLSGSFICLVFWVLATLFYGRIYCSLLCPLGIEPELEMDVRCCADAGQAASALNL